MSSALTLPLIEENLEVIRIAIELYNGLIGQLAISSNTHEKRRYLQEIIRNLSLIFEERKIDSRSVYNQ